MTAMKLLERVGIRSVLRCEICASTAWASTPSGFRCQTHAVDELEQAIADHRADWMPRRLRRRRL